LPIVYQELAEWEPTKFLGYETLKADSTILALIRHDTHGTQAVAGEEAEVITGASPFYGETGGQVGDSGWITGPGYKLKVTNTQRLPNDLIVHQGLVEEGVVKVNDPAVLSVDAERRRQIERHHTATHILQAALRKHLGEHVKQSGSLVAPERLRFDFTHFQAISPEELEQLEHDLNAAVADNYPLETKRMPLAQALESGTMALFEEKYGAEVRVVAIPGLSRELCGGTHVRRTGDIGLCKITSEASVAAGIRRLEAVCGPAAITLMQEMTRELDQAAGLLKGSRGDLLNRLDKVLKRQKELEKEVETLKSRLATAQAKDLMEEVREIDGVKVLALEVQATDPKSLREYAVKFMDRLQSGIVVLGSAVGEKAMLIALVSKDLTKRFPAGEIIRELAPTIGGSGGGKPDLAQAGGPDKDKIGKALEQVYEVIGKKAKQ
jgi:alanyl-tRNA synthetase